MRYFFNNKTKTMNNALQTPTKFESVGILARVGRHSIAETLLELVQILQKMGVQVVASTETAKIITLPSQAHFEIAPADTLAKRCDLIIVVGGDGSILQAVNVVAGTAVPILGINRGRLGFLADVSPDELEQSLTAVLTGQYHLDKRFLLSMQIIENDKLIHQAVALNDIVLHAGKSVHTIDYQLAIDGQAVYRHHADGLIVSTPTGSTAYALAAGGAILQSGLRAFTLVPICPQSMTNRPIVIADDNEMEILITKAGDARLHYDGQTFFDVQAMDKIILHRYEYTVRVIQPIHYQYYGTLRQKLHWGEQLV